MSFKALEDAVVQACNSVFGIDVSYTPKNSSAVSIKGVFDNSWIDIEGMISLKPTLRIRLSDLPATPGKGDSVVISDTSYRVLESRDDGYGGSTLILHKV